MACEKRTQYERLESKLQALRGRLSDQGEATSRKFNVIKDQLVKISNQVELQRKYREDVIAAKKKEM
jgi:hypothetical protein